MSFYKKAKNWASSFWYDDYDTSFDYLETYGSYKPKELDAFKKTHNLYKLASVRRAITNFVQIVTNKSIPVTFATKSESMTDGKKVILSADVDDNFDVSVGLALHEGSHIVLSDFKMLKAYNDVRNHLEYAFDSILQDATIPDSEKLNRYYERVTKYVTGYGADYKKEFMEIWGAQGKIGSVGIATTELLDLIQGLNNWIEDRRIDHYIYTSAPGYRDYYVSMYDHYFNDKIVTKGVASDEFTEETLDSYMFRIINLLNESTDLKKLKGLRGIYRKLDLKNINRLKSSKDSINLAIDILAEMLKHAPIESATQRMQKMNGGGNGDGEVPVIDDITGMEFGDGDGDGQKVRLSKNAMEQLKKKFEKQKDFLKGEVKKKKITNVENRKLDDIQESGTELVHVGSDYQNGNNNTYKGVDCIVVKRLTPKLMESEDFPFTNKSWRNET